MFGSDKSFTEYAHRSVAHMALDFERATRGGVMRYGYMDQLITAWRKYGKTEHTRRKQKCVCVCKSEILFAIQDASD